MTSCNWSGRLEMRAARTLFRIVRTNPPTEEDFWSNERKGRKCRDPQNKELWDGVSTYLTVEEARETALGYPPVAGEWIAELRFVEEPGVIRAQRTGKTKRRHYTIWADPGVLLASVVRVVPVGREYKK
jgi:hypothetical protein